MDYRIEWHQGLPGDLINDTALALEWAYVADAGPTATPPQIPREVHFSPSLANPIHRTPGDSAQLCLLSRGFFQCSIRKVCAEAPFVCLQLVPAEQLKTLCPESPAPSPSVTQAAVSPPPPASNCKADYVVMGPYPQVALPYPHCPQSRPSQER